MTIKLDYTHVTTHHPYAETRATRMIAGAVRRIRQEQGLSLRELAQKVGYKSAVALSHFATGRAPLPLDKAIELADGLGLNRREFALAVFEQRHPDLSTEALRREGAASPLSDRDVIVLDLEDIAGCALDKIEAARLAIVREVLTDRDPTRRWLNVEELPIVVAVREALSDGRLTRERRQKLIDAARA